MLVVGLAALFASGGPGRLAGASDGEYDLSGMIRLVFSDIDTVCDDPNLAQSGGELLKQMENEILTSLIVDSQIVISPEELGEYSCLVLTDPAWVARFGDPGKLRAVELESVSQEMQEFLSAQMPLWTADGSVLPEGVGLYEYIGQKPVAHPHREPGHSDGPIWAAAPNGIQREPGVFRPGQAGAGAHRQRCGFLCRRYRGVPAPAMK